MARDTPCEDSRRIATCGMRLRFVRFIMGGVYGARGEIFKVKRRKRLFALRKNVRLFRINEIAELHDKSI